METGLYIMASEKSMLEMRELITSSTNAKEFNDNIERCMEILYSEAWNTRNTIAANHRDNLRMSYSASANDWAWSYGKYASALKWSEIMKSIMKNKPDAILDPENEYLYEYGFIIYVNNISGFPAK